MGMSANLFYDYKLKKYFLRSLGPFQHDCNVCGQRFPLSCALLIHKVYRHISNSEPKIEIFLPELVMFESINSSDSDYDYVFVVQTTVQQTPKIKLESVADLTSYDEATSPLSVNEEHLLMKKDIDHTAIGDTKTDKNPEISNVEKTIIESITSAPATDELLCAPRIRRGRSKKTIARLPVTLAPPPITTKLLNATDSGGCKCTICDFQSDRTKAFVHIFTSHRERIRHINDSDFATFSCDLCPKTFRQFVYYKNHQRYLHLNESTKNFLCNTCGKRFPSNHYLAVHELKHSNGRRPFECDICGKGFVSKQSITSHLWAHVGKKPFVCEVDGCDASFTHLSGRSQHFIIKHKLEMEHECKVCSRQFRLPKQLA